MVDNIPVRLGGGVFYQEGGTPRVAVAVFRNKSSTELTLITPDGIEQFKVSKFEDQGVSGRLVFVSSKKSHIWRPFREADGAWVSRYRVALPTDAIIGAINFGGEMPSVEALDAYTSDDAPYVLGVVYSNPQGRWVRNSGRWVSLAQDDDTYADMNKIVIAPDKSKDFLSVYDRNFVTVSDASEYEG